jgi:hypothetical protein
MQKHISKPTVVEAIQFTGSNGAEIEAVVGDDRFVYETDVLLEGRAKVYDELHDSWINVYPGNWIIRGTKFEYYPCEDGVFREKYERYEDDDS